MLQKWRQWWDLKQRKEYDHKNHNCKFSHVKVCIPHTFTSFCSLFLTFFFFFPPEKDKASHGWEHCVKHTTSHVHCSQRSDKLTENMFCYAWRVDSICLIFSHRRSHSFILDATSIEEEKNSTSLWLSSLHYSSNAALLCLL